MDPDGTDIKQVADQDRHHLTGQVHVSGQFGNRYRAVGQRQQRPLLCGFGQPGRSASVSTRVSQRRPGRLVVVRPPVNMNGRMSPRGFWVPSVLTAARFFLLA